MVERRWCACSQCHSGVANSSTATSRQTDKVGALVALDAAVTLREYVEPKTLETRKAQAKKAAKARRKSAPKKTATKTPEAPVLDARDGWDYLARPITI